MIAAYLEIGDMQNSKWVTKMEVHDSSWAGPAHLHMEGVLVGETTLFSLQSICLDELNHDTYRIIDIQNRVFTMDARLLQVECNTQDADVRLLLYLSASEPREHPKLKSPLRCYKDTCVLPPHEYNSVHSSIPEAS